MKFNVKWLLLISWMLIIFFFSAQTGEQSSQSSGLVEQLLSIFSFIPNRIFGLELKFLIRKAAHFTEYALLGLCLMLHLDAIGKKIAIKLPWLISWGIGTLYALTDEWHQGFVGGRHPAILDVTIDSCGVAVGVLVLVLLLRRRNRPLP